MISTEFTAVLLGLAAAIGWGAGDFGGGVAAKRTSTYLVVFIFNSFGAVIMAATISIFGEAMPATGDLLFGLAAGIAGAIGLAAFLRGLSHGNMGMVAPLTAVISASIPVIFSLFNEGRVESHKMVGFAIALLAIVIISSGSANGRLTLRDFQLPLIAGMGFGLFFIFLDAASSQAVLWPVLAARIGSASLMAVLITATRGWKRPSASQVPLLAVSSIFDVTGNIMFALAASIGRLDIAVILSSLYPAITVLLARFTLHERITRRQWVGLGTALVAVVLIAW